MAILELATHKWMHCTDPDCPGCNLCHGGLSLCCVCGGGEGSLPTDCPGQSMNDILHDDVYAGKVDYRRKEGWVQRPSVMWEGIRRWQCT